jgi:aspartate carbamoyltransferase catalytic subunit
MVKDSVTKKINYKKSDLLHNKNIFNLFFEPSTRTRSTFELAAKNLSANVINLNIDTSSMQKGETLKDTILTIKAMQADCIVIRHKQSGIAQSIANLCADELSVINAGDGINSHPTQALLDMYTILQHKPDLSNLKIAIIGDILNSRVARSQIAALKILGCTNINLIGPEILLPINNEYHSNHVTIYHDLKTGIKDADVICGLRLQKERMQHSLILDDSDYFNNYGITEDILKLAKPNAIVMHPGPLNREIEISSEVADGPQSVILEQVTNGVAIRMAVYETLLS